MKNITKIALVFLSGTLLGSSCVDFLEREPKTGLMEEVVYGSEAGLEASIIGCYSGMRSSSLWQGDMFELHGCASGLIHWKGDRKGDEKYEQGLNLTFFTSSAVNQSVYAQTYAVINRINDVIAHLPESPVDEAFKTEINGEAHLLRGIMYFLAVRMWGNVPLTLEPFSSIAESNIPRTCYLDIYKQILDDLTVAENEMRDEDRQAEVSGTSGRPNKWAATAFKAKVYLQIASIWGYADEQPFRETPDFTNCGIETAEQAWQLALETAEKVIYEGPYQLAPSFADLFRWTDPADFQLKERIFVLQSTENGTSTSNYTALRSLPNYPVGSAQTTATNSNWGRVRPSRFFFQKFARTYGGVPQTGRKDGLQNVIVSCPDPRFDLSFFYNSYEQYNKGKTRTREIYPADGLVNDVNSKNSGNETGQPYFKKYLDPKFNANKGYADFYLLRYADMYLTAAEAAAELSQAPGDAMWQKAFSHIETIHQRARNSTGGTPAEQPRWENDRFTSKEELIAAIVYERFYEMCGEGHEWFDLRRRGAQFMIDNFSIPMNEFLQQPEQLYPDSPNDNFTNFMYFSASHAYPTTKAEMLKHLLCPFPEAEIRNNSAIDYSDQNPYYVR